MNPGILASQFRPAPSVAPPAIGEYWGEQGGWYVGIVTRSSTGEQWHVVLADKAAEFTAQWKTSATGTSGMSGHFTGAQYTDAQLAAGAAEHPAAAQCRAYTGGGFADWSMPSTSEMLALRDNGLDPATTTNPTWKYGGSQAPASADYWSAAQASSSGNAYYGRFDSDLFPQVAKTTVFRVRPTRTIPV